MSDPTEQLTRAGLLGLPIGSIVLGRRPGIPMVEPWQTLDRWRMWYTIAPSAHDIHAYDSYTLWDRYQGGTLHIAWPPATPDGRG